MDDLGFGDAVFHVIDSVPDDQRENDADDVVCDDRDPSPGEIFPIALEIGCERSDAIEHAFGVPVSKLLSLDDVRDLRTRYWDYCGFAVGAAEGALASGAGWEG